MSEVGGVILTVALFLAVIFGWAFVKVNVIDPIVQRRRARRAYALAVLEACMLHAEDERQRREMSR